MRSICWFCALNVTFFLAAACGNNTTDSNDVVSCDIDQNGLHYCEEVQTSTSATVAGCPTDTVGVTPGTGCARDGIAGNCSANGYTIYFYDGEQVASAVASICQGSAFNPGTTAAAPASSSATTSSTNPARPGFATCDFIAAAGSYLQHNCWERALAPEVPSTACDMLNTKGGFGFSRTTGCSTTIPGCVCHQLPLAQNGNTEGYVYYYTHSDPNLTQTDYLTKMHENCMSDVAGESFLCFGGASVAGAGTL